MEIFGALLLLIIYAAPVVAVGSILFAISETVKRYKICRECELPPEKKIYNHLATGIFITMLICAAIAMYAYGWFFALMWVYGAFYLLPLCILIVLATSILGAMLLRKINKSIRQPEPMKENKIKRFSLAYIFTSLVMWLAVLLTKLIFFADFSPPSGS